MSEAWTLWLQARSVYMRRTFHHLPIHMLKLYFLDAGEDGGSGNSTMLITWLPFSLSMINGTVCPEGVVRGGGKNFENDFITIHNSGCLSENDKKEK